MKNVLILLIVLVVFSSSWVFAGVEGDPVFIDQDINGSIRVWVEYKTDGVVEPSRYEFKDGNIKNSKGGIIGTYTDEKLTGKQLYCSRYNAGNFLGMTDLQMKTRILKDVKAHTESLIRSTYIPIANDDIVANHLKDIIGSKITTTDLTINVDTDGDGVNDKEVTITTGTAAITP